MAKNRGKARKAWRQARAQKNNVFNNIFDYEVEKTLAEVNKRREVGEATPNYVDRLRERLAANPMWVDHDKRFQALEPKPN